MPGVPTRDELLPAGLPDGRVMVAEGRNLCRQIRLGESLFHRRYGVRSEAQYKARMVEQGEVMLHAQIGLSDWSQTKKGLSYVYSEAAKRGVRIDRIGFSFDVRMGLPEDRRDDSQPETGLLLQTRQEWLEMGQIVPAALHFGDHVIGTPASVENVRNCLEAGSTTIGSFEHFFFFDYPGWTEDIERAKATVRSLGILAGFRSLGVRVHSNLGSHESYFWQFADRCSVVGWAMLEQYIAEELIGVNLVHCFGNFAEDPTVRLAMLFALDEVHAHARDGSMIHGNTMLTEDTSRNAAVLSTCLLFDVIAQMRRPTGHAVQGLPLTEAMRIPEPQEILEGAVIADQIIQEARLVADLVDIGRADRLRDQLLVGGRAFQHRTLAELKRQGFDIRDPLQMMLVLRRLGGQTMEQCFGPGDRDSSTVGGRRPVVPTEMFVYVSEAQQRIRHAVMEQGLQGKLQGMNVLICSTDIHRGGTAVISAALAEAGASVCDAGIAEPLDVVHALYKKHFDLAAISTHNGKALSYGRLLRDLLRQEGLTVPVFMGGRLNQDEGKGLPRDVATDLLALGIVPLNDAVMLVKEAGARTGLT